MLSCDVLSKRSGTARRLVLNAAAKINLTLEVLGRRNDGYHEIVTVMQTVDLSDRLVVEDADVLELRTTASDVPTDGTNLALRAAAALRDGAGLSRGARITLEKRIPVAAGLGGGSADAAAVLVGVNRLWGVRWSSAGLAGGGGAGGGVWAAGGGPAFLPPRRRGAGDRKGRAARASGDLRPGARAREPARCGEHRRDLRRGGGGPVLRAGAGAE